MRLKLYSLLLCTLFSFTLAVTKRCQRPPNTALKQLTSYMAGNFTGPWIEEEHTKLLYYVTMRSESIWSQRTDGIWLHVTHTKSGVIQPFRRRVFKYKKYGSNGMIVASEYIYYNATEPFFEKLHQILRCDIYYMRVDDITFRGARRPGYCRADNKGADFVTRDMLVNPWKISDHFRGFIHGTQQWGDPEPQVYTRAN